MKKVFSSCLLATGLFTISQFATAVDSDDPANGCPSLTEIQALALREVTYNRYGNTGNTYTVSTGYQNKEDKSRIPAFYQYNFSVTGVKGADAEDAIKKVKNALSITTAANLTVTRVDHYVSSSCTYSLNFSTSDDNYNGAYPVATVDMYYGI